MRTKCPVDMKQTTLEREICKLLLYARKLILTYAQFYLLVPKCLTYATISKKRNCPFKLVCDMVNVWSFCYSRMERWKKRKKKKTFFGIDFQVKSDMRQRITALKCIFFVQQKLKNALLTSQSQGNMGVMTQAVEVVTRQQQAVTSTSVAVPPKTEITVTQVATG